MQPLSTKCVSFHFFSTLLPSVLIIALLCAHAVRTEGVGQFDWIESRWFSTVAKIVVAGALCIEVAYRSLRAVETVPAAIEIPYRAYLSLSILGTTLIFLVAARSVMQKLKQMNNEDTSGRRRPGGNRSGVNGTGGNGGDGSGAQSKSVTRTTVLIAMIALLGVLAVLIAATYAALVAFGVKHTLEYFAIANAFGQVLKVALQFVILRGITPPRRAAAKKAKRNGFTSLDSPRPSGASSGGGGGRSGTPRASKQSSSDPEIELQPMHQPQGKITAL